MRSPKPATEVRRNLRAMQYVAAIDQGTTSTRCAIFDQSANLVAIDQREHDQLTPRPGWVEHDPHQILARTEAVIAGALAEASLEPSNLVAIGIANQRETTVIWDRQTGQPIAPAIVWQDTRTDALCQRLEAEGGKDRFRSRVGLPIATYFSGPKIRWLLDHINGARTAANQGQLMFGTMDSWLAWNLTGHHVTDVTNASRTMLMNLERLQWDKEMLELFDIPATLLPGIVPSSGVVARCRGQLAGVPLAGILGDQQAALFGQVCFGSGEVKNTYGTGCFLLMNTGEAIVQSKHGLITTVAYQLEGKAPRYALEGSIAIAGAAVQWLRDNLGLIAAASDIEALARSVTDNGGVYFVPAFNGLFAPYWREDARGVIVGLTRYAGRGHLARAVLEATVYQTRDVLQAMQRDCETRLPSLKVDGGMANNDLLLQLQADQLQIPVVRSAITETTALGAAFAAGLAVGFWRDQDELRGRWQQGREFLPTSTDSGRDKRYHEWQRAVSRSFGWVETRA